MRTIIEGRRVESEADLLRAFNKEVRDGRTLWTAIRNDFTDDPTVPNNLWRLGAILLSRGYRESGINVDPRIRFKGEDGDPVEYLSDWMGVGPKTVHQWIRDGERMGLWTRFRYSRADLATSWTLNGVNLSPRISQVGKKVFLTEDEVKDFNSQYPLMGYSAKSYRNRQEMDRKYPEAMSSMSEAYLADMEDLEEKRRNLSGWTRQTWSVLRDGSFNAAEARWFALMLQWATFKAGDGYRFGVCKCRTLADFGHVLDVGRRQSKRIAERLEEKGAIWALPQMNRHETNVYGPRPSKYAT